MFIKIVPGMGEQKVIKWLNCILFWHINQIPFAIPAVYISNNDNIIILPHEYNSSEPSTQSGLKSHFHLEGMHSPEPHKNSFLLQEPVNVPKNNNNLVKYI